jgi:hypothetical protein
MLVAQDEVGYMSGNERKIAWRLNISVLEANEVVGYHDDAKGRKTHLQSAQHRCRWDGDRFGNGPKKLGIGHNSHR